MENKEWTEKDEIHKYMNNAAKLNEMFFNITSKIENHDRRIGKLPPIAIYYNNKMVEIYHYFQNKKVPYINSKVNYILNSYFTFLMRRALLALNNYLDSNNSLMSTSDIEEFEEIKRESLNEYKYLCNQILDFSIEKDAPETINNYLSIINKNETYDEYVEELNQLGVNNQSTSQK